MNNLFKLLRWVLIPLFCIGGAIWLQHKQKTVWGLSEVERARLEKAKRDEKAKKARTAEIDEAKKAFFPKGTKVYVAGYEQLANFRRSAVVWENGNVLYRLGDNETDSEAFSVFVAGEDVYVAGYEDTKRLSDIGGGLQLARVWKNGVAQHLSEAGKGTPRFRSVFVSDGDVYVAGAELLPIDPNKAPSVMNRRFFATVWKNGKVLHRLKDGHTASSIFVVGKDVYVAGQRYTGNNNHNNRSVTVWKNGKILHDLSIDNMPGEAGSIFVSNNDVYVAGWEMDANRRQFATVWKNGMPRYSIAPDKSSALATSVFVQGNDIYATGWEIVKVDYFSDPKWTGISRENATVWKNGDVLPLSGGRPLPSDNRGNPLPRTGEDIVSGQAMSIYVTGDNFWVVGNLNHANKKVATVWKNDGHIYLSDTKFESSASSVFVVQNIDINIVGGR